jgi:hypothetical protein
MEIGDTQSAAVRDLIRQDGHYQEPTLVKDQAGIPRIVVARKK